MGRPRLNSLLYFTHDCVAYDHPKFVALRSHYGGERGRAMEQRFWQLNGMIGRADGCLLDIRPEYAKPALAEKLDLSVDELDEFLSFLSDPKRCDLIENRGGLLTTDRCQEELRDMLDSNEKDRSRKAGLSKHAFSSGKQEYSHGSPQENQSFPARETGIQGFSTEEGRKEGRKGEEKTPPVPAPHPSKEADSATPQKKASPLDPVSLLRAVNPSLVMSDSDRAKLAELIALEPWETILEAYRAQQARIPGKAWHFFVQDFARWKNQAHAAAKKSPGKPYVPPELHRPTPQDDAEVERLAAEARAKLHLPPAQAPPPAPPEQSHLADDDVF